MMYEDLLTIADAARRKGVSRSAVYKAIAQGQLAAQKVLGKMAARGADVEAWHPRERKGRRKGTPMSDAAKRRISEAQKRRWAKKRQEG